MNVKYAIILASGLSSTVAVMSQAAPLTNGDIDSPSQDAMILPMEESKVSVVYDPKTSVVFTDEGIKGTSDGLTLDLGEIDFGSGDYDRVWVEMANVMKPTEQTGFDFYLDDMLLEPKTDFTIAQELPHLDSYESDKQPQEGLFFKNQNVPLSQISVIDVRGDDSYGKITAAVAQGVLNQSNAEVYLVYEDHHQTQFEDVYGKQGETWNLLRGNYSEEKYAGLATLVDKYKDRFKKMVLWDPDKEWTWCLAQMICAKQKGIPVTKEIKEFFNNDPRTAGCSRPCGGGRHPRRCGCRDYGSHPCHGQWQVHPEGRAPCCKWLEQGWCQRHHRTFLTQEEKHDTVYRYSGRYFPEFRLRTVR